MSADDDRALLVALFERAVSAADPQQIVGKYLPPVPKGRTIVVGAGKASAQMAQAFEQAWPGPLQGLVVTRYGHGVPTERIEVVEASHPVSDAVGLVAAQRLMAAVSGLTADDLVVALISGGGSALLPAPPEGLTLEHDQAIQRALLESGAPIAVMNAIRSELSGIKGGRLAALAAPARVVTLVVSDVPGDDPALVASGPTVPSVTDRGQTRRLVDLYGIELPPEAAALLRGDSNPLPQPDDPRFADNVVEVIASARLSLEAAAATAQAAGIEAHILSDGIEGEARDAGRFLGAIAREIALRNRPFGKPALLLSGGETTITLETGRGPWGKGGRNSEFLLAFAIGVHGVPGITAIAADTDGIDGTENNAGAFADGTSIGRMREAGIDPLEALRRHDAYSAFAAIGDLLVTGPTGTNVNDFRAVLIR